MDLPGQPTLPSPLERLLEIVLQEKLWETLSPERRAKLVDAMAANLLARIAKDDWNLRSHLDQVLSKCTAEVLETMKDRMIAAVKAAIEATFELTVRAHAEKMAKDAIAEALRTRSYR